ncbi:hypothetical protein [Streptomyces sp. ISL-98]|uniref:hypothetical protein n=1 Tax=Streptomyces sp. ISL-98 TaxID=2819192 RepID=UPI001BE8E31D|nr:hypothetical protein [Streptomyces sp. ISL-98]
MEVSPVQRRRGATATDCCAGLGSAVVGVDRSGARGVIAGKEDEAGGARQCVRRVPEPGDRFGFFADGAQTVGPCGPGVPAGAGSGEEATGSLEDVRRPLGPAD